MLVYFVQVETGRDETFITAILKILKVGFLYLGDLLSIRCVAFQDNEYTELGHLRNVSVEHLSFPSSCPGARRVRVRGFTHVVGHCFACAIFMFLPDLCRNST